MPITKFRSGFSITQDRLEQLKTVVPEAFADGKINWEALKQALGEFLEDESPEAEHFGLFWPGKRDARRLAALPSKGTLAPAAGEGLDEDKTRNIFIEGENLEVLKLLQKSYAGRIKMIYIDPPYNTGNDFVYKDDFKEPLEEYLRRTGQVDENGKLLTTNTKADGRFHSNWLNMMYPRLVLARQLLVENGIVFISIDDNEVHNLRLVMDQVFGEESFIAQFVWKSRQNKDNRNVTGVSIDHEYVLVYGKRVRGAERKMEQYSNPDNDSRGPWTSANMIGLLPQDQRPNCHYELINPETGINYGKPQLGWRYDRSTMAKLIAEQRIIWPSTSDGRPRRKVFLSELKSEFTGYSSIIGNNVFTRDGTAETESLLGPRLVDFPKPMRLIKDLILQGSNESDFILDFFAGSCTTAQAVIELNQEDGGNRRFIMVQLPEPTPKDSPARKSGYKTIAEIGKERIRRVIAKMIKERNGNSSSNRETPEDLGFKVFKLDRSNFKAWHDYDGENIQELETLFDQAETPLVEGWKDEDLLTEIILQQGFPLDSKIMPQSDFKQNKVRLIESEACTHRLFVCLDSKIKEDTIKHLELRAEDIFVCLDSALADQAKMRLADVCRLSII
jgi:adenine-specific DNA-methyltransferase